MVHKPVETAMKVIDHVDVLLGYWDSHLKCQFANATHETWFGRSPGEMLGISMKDLLGSLYELNLPHIKGALNGEVQVFERDISLPDGSTRHSLACYFPDASDGIVKGFSVQVTDVSKIKRLEIELQTAKLKAELLATHDFLTGCPTGSCSWTVSLLQYLVLKNHVTSPLWSQSIWIDSRPSTTHMVTNVAMPY